MTNHAIESYQRARAVLDAGVAAIGGAEALGRTASVRRVMSAERMDPGQARGAWNGKYEIGELPVYSRGTMTSLLDYAGNRMWINQTDDEVAGDDNSFTEVIAPEGSFTLRSMRREAPVYASMPDAAARGRMARELRLYPEGVLRTALRNVASLQWSGEAMVDGAPADVISVVEPMGQRVLLYFDRRTRLLRRSETLSDHPVLGDSTLSATYSDYRPAGGLRLAHRIVSRRSDQAARNYRVKSIEVNAPIDAAALVAPATRIDAPADPAQPTLTQVGDGVYQVRGEYNVMFALFDDYVVLVEAPRDADYTRQVFELIRSVEPRKPVKVVATHHHFDHIGGIRYAATVADEIWATADAKAEIERALHRRGTIRSDAWAGARQAPVRLITGRHRFSDGRQQVDLADVGPLPHAEQILVAHFANAATMLVADIWDAPAPEVGLTTVDSAAMLAKVDTLGWAVRTVVPIHGVPANVATLRREVEARHRYLAAAGQPAAAQD